MGQTEQNMSYKRNDYNSLLSNITFLMELFYNNSLFFSGIPISKQTVLVSLFSYLLRKQDHTKIILKEFHQKLMEIMLTIRQIWVENSQTILRCKTQFLLASTCRCFGLQTDLQYEQVFCLVNKCFQIKPFPSPFREQTRRGSRLYCKCIEGVNLE